MQEQYDKIHRFFKTTTEHYDSLEWNGSELAVVLHDRTIERYSYADLCTLIPDLLRTTDN